MKTNYKIDPENVYLSHAPRLRVQAEFVKDMILSSSGLTGKNNWWPERETLPAKRPCGKAQHQAEECSLLINRIDGESLYRRGMYTFIKLTVPPPNMVIFDASNRDECEVKRLETNTPLQALMMMNDPTVLEASRVLAQKLLEEKGSVDEKITKSFSPDHLPHA